MTEDFERELEKHLDAYPERWKLVSEMRLEWNSFKTRFFWTVIGSAGLFISIGVWVGTIQAEVGHNIEEILKIEQNNIQMEARLGSLEVNNSDIKARLINIEALLIDIQRQVRGF